MKNSYTESEALLQSMRRAIQDAWESVTFPDSPRNLYDPVRHAFLGKGKRIRPLLVLLGCHAGGGDWRKALPAALSVEILHLFTLVHDDIMDNDTRRRGMPTIHVKWDRNIALLAGDALFALALSKLYETDSDNIDEIAQLMARGMLKICEGQALDYEFEKREDVTLDEYEEMVLRKTGILLGLSLRTGGMISKTTPETLSALNTFGEQLGIAFQIQDDLLEITSDERTMGKSLFSDIKAFKKTYPLLLALPRMSRKQRDEYRKTIESETDTFKLKSYVLSVFREFNVIADCENIIERKIAAAHESLGIIDVKKRVPLEQVAETILKRES